MDNVDNDKAEEALSNKEQVEGKLPQEQTQEEALLPARKKSRKRNIIIFSMVSVVNVGLLILLWTQLLTPASNSTPSGTPANTDLLIGKTAPNFTLATLSSSKEESLSLASYKGKPVVLNFWQSSCAPCNDEAPMLQAQWVNAQSQGIVFIGVDLDDNHADALKFSQQYGLTYTSVYDNSGNIAVDYAVTYIPETIFINSAGKVVVAVRQEISEKQFQTDLQKIIK